jgi:hypothetical protein
LRFHAYPCGKKGFQGIFKPPEIIRNIVFLCIFLRKKKDSQKVKDVVPSGTLTVNDAPNPA